MELRSAGHFALGGRLRETPLAAEGRERAFAEWLRSRAAHRFRAWRQSSRQPTLM